jgi:hypothetical protein
MLKRPLKHRNNVPQEINNLQDCTKSAACQKLVHGFPAWSMLEYRRNRYILVRMFRRDEPAIESPALVSLQCA